MNNKLKDWGGPVFIRVSKKKYENFCRYFEDKIEFNAFMGWYDTYDFSYEKCYEDKGYGDCKMDRCMVARQYFEGPRAEYYIRADYIWKNGYDLNTIVPKPRRKRLPKSYQKVIDHMCDAFDAIFRQEAMTKIKEEDDDE